MKKLFGTDGIRGISRRSPLTPEEVTVLGSSAGTMLRQHFSNQSIRLLAIRDTRESGPLLLRQLSKGLTSQGIDVYDAGVLCTPAAAYLVQRHRFHSAVVISASHNPPEFNGIKFFNEKGEKWSDRWEELVEKIIFSRSKLPLKKNEKGFFVPAHALGSDYEEFIIKSLPERKFSRKIKVAMDCGNGANYLAGPNVLSHLGANITVINAGPTGDNINVQCGSQHTQGLSHAVVENKCHVGVAFDGDADRVIFTDEKGSIIDGDFVIALLAAHFKKMGRLKNNTVVITVMANLGLKEALRKLRIRMIETPVGDRHVSEAMRKHGAVLGGEPSGHIILGDYLPSGDGLLTAVHVLSLFSQQGKSFSSFVGIMKKYPQVLINKSVQKKLPIEQIPSFSDIMKSIEKKLGSQGRLVVRYSGTEPLLRIMLEGPDKKDLDQFGAELAACVTAARI